jgi:hypothetical protein
MATKIWPKGGEFAVRARARCATDPSVISDWTPDLIVKVELITPPSAPIGQVKGLPGDTFTYMTGGASSNINDPIEYQFDWGDGTVSPWQSSTSASKTWSQGGTFEVRARARCALHTFIESTWSSGLTVNIEKISKPNTPSGPQNGIPFTSYTYTAGGATSNIGDPVEYQFDWGDFTTSGWIRPDAGGVAKVSHSWQFGGKFTVRVKARCAIHPFIESELSDPLEVEIETVTAPTTPISSDLPSGGIGVTGTDYTFSTSGAVSNLDHPVEYQFDWGDGTQSLWISPDEDGTASLRHKWTRTGSFSVRARARCKTHPQAVSDWSGVFFVTIN